MSIAMDAVVDTARSKLFGNVIFCHHPGCGFVGYTFVFHHDIFPQSLLFSFLPSYLLVFVYCSSISPLCSCFILSSVLTSLALWPAFRFCPPRVNLSCDHIFVPQRSADVHQSVNRAIRLLRSLGYAAYRLPSEKIPKYLRECG